MLTVVFAATDVAVERQLRLIGFWWSILQSTPKHPMDKLIIERVEQYSFAAGGNQPIFPGFLLKGEYPGTTPVRLLGIGLHVQHLPDVHLN